MIDAYARAVALAGNEPAEQANKKIWMEQLTVWYKYRNKSDAGLNELIAGILTKPMPGEPTPLTALPVSASGAGTTTTGDAASAAGVPASGAAKPAATPANTAAPKPGTTTTPATGNAATSTPKPTPKPRRNHVRRG